MATGHTARIRVSKEGFETKANIKIREKKKEGRSARKVKKKSETQNSQSAAISLRRSWDVE